MQMNPTRQKLWRVLRVGSIILAAWSVVCGLHRIHIGFSDLVAPPTMTVLHFTKNDRTIAHLRLLTQGMNIVPEIPLSLADALNKSNRSISVWFADEGSTTILIDQILSDTELAALQAFGATVAQENGYTIISNTTITTPIETNLFRGAIATIRTSTDGTLGQGAIQTGITLESHTATLHGAGLLTAPNLDKPITENTVFSAQLSGSDIATFLPKSFTQNTPGMASLFALAGANGISAQIHIGLNTSYTFSIPLTPETQSFANEDALTQLAKELVEVPTIKGIATFLDDGSRSTTLRSREEAVVVVRDDAPYRFITATSSQGAAYITQTPTVLTISNSIQNTETLNRRSNECLPNTRAFVRPNDLLSALRIQTQYESSSLATMLWRVNEIASTSSTTRICIAP